MQSEIRQQKQIDSTNLRARASAENKNQVSWAWCAFLEDAMVILTRVKEFGGSPQTILRSLVAQLDIHVCEYDWVWEDKTSRGRVKLWKGGRCSPDQVKLRRVERAPRLGLCNDITYMDESKKVQCYVGKTMGLGLYCLQSSILGCIKCINTQVYQWMR